MGLHAGSCRIEDCGGQANYHGMCQKHYKRIYRQIKKSEGEQDFSPKKYESLAHHFNNQPAPDNDAFWRWITKHLGIYGANYRMKSF